MSTWLILKQRLFDERGYFCECGCGQQGHDLHHGLIHNIKKGGKTKYPILNNERNLFIVNHWQHIARMFDNDTWRVYFWNRNVERYGLDSMLEWRDNLPEKIKPRMDFIERIRNEQNENVRARQLLRNQ